VDRLRTALATGFEDLRAGEILVIDLTEVTFLASHGLEILVDATETAQQRDQLLRIVVGHSRSVIRPIQLSGLADVLALFNTVEGRRAGTDVITDAGLRSRMTAQLATTH
jgi:anti-sigma B factor antagonist